MPIKINSNVQSLSAQRQVALTGDALGRVFERLSSGQRINRASDDAAGLSIASVLKSNTRVLAQASRNLNDGISVLNIADSALGQLTNIVSRLVELAEQSANGSYKGGQRSAMDKEAQALSREYSRIAETTSFNDIGLLNGGLGKGIALQAGSGSSGLINSDIGGQRATGSLASGSTITGATAASRFSDIKLADINGDGINDFIGVAVKDGAAGGVLEVAFGVGDGTFGTSQSYSLGPLDLRRWKLEISTEMASLTWP